MATQTSMQRDFEMTRGKEVVLGVLLVLGGAAAIFANWVHALTEGMIRHGGAILGPLLLLGGIMLIAAPYPDKSNFPNLEFAPRSWNAFVLAGVVLGLINWFLLNY